MREIREHIFDRMQADSTLQGYTGYTASDERIYLEFPPEGITLDSTLPAYITYTLMKPAPIDPTMYVDGAQFPDIALEINVWANDPDTRDNVGERISELFKDYYFTTTSFRVTTTVKEVEEDIVELQEGTDQINLWRKYLRFRMWPVYKL